MKIDPNNVDDYLADCDDKSRLLMVELNNKKDTVSWRIGEILLCTICSSPKIDYSKVHEQMVRAARAITRTMEIKVDTVIIN